MTVEFPETLSTKEAAQILRRHPRTVARWVRAGMLPGTYNKATGLTLVYADALLEWLHAGEAEHRLAPKRVVAPGIVRSHDLADLTDDELAAYFAA